MEILIVGAIHGLAIAFSVWMLAIPIRVAIYIMNGR